MVSESDVLKLLASSNWLTKGSKRKNLTRHLRSAVNGEDGIIASRAIYLAAEIKTKVCIQIVKDAAFGRNTNLRIAAASVASELPLKDAVEVLSKLLNSKNISIRKKALESAAKLMAAELLPQLKVISKRDPVFSLKQLAKKLVAQLT